MLDWLFTGLLELDELSKNFSFLSSGSWLDTVELDLLSNLCRLTNDNAKFDIIVIVCEPLKLHDATKLICSRVLVQF